MALPWSVFVIVTMLSAGPISVPEFPTEPGLSGAAAGPSAVPTPNVPHPQSESIGHPFTGRLKNASRMPRYGEHHELLPRTAHRQYVYAVDELVDGLTKVAAELRVNDADAARLVIGNMSRRSGGDIHCSRSHNTGRDADLGLFTLDTSGRSVRARYHRFGKNGRSLEAGGRYRFDVPRNWRLIKALLTTEAFDVQWLILNPHLERMVLEHARAIGEPEALVALADAVIELPSYANLHRNHLHLRIGCPDGHARCEPGGPVRKNATRVTLNRIE
ncbi:MAG: penicillin-insensitive murein endopeptidase [Myxococcota bacterium]|jgi:penicillin-insensitive murein endopeptidase